MEEVNIFLTQQRSDWCQALLEQSRHALGHENETWTTRAMMALKPAGLVGKRLTVREIEDKLAPYIGLSLNRHSLNNMVRRAINRGIVERTGRTRYVEGTRNKYPEYKINGHLEIDTDGNFHSVRLRKPDEGDDAGRSRSVLRAGRVRQRKQAHQAA